MPLSKKIFGVPALKKILSKHRKQGKKIAFTNGCFDIMHVGHVTYLQKAKKGNRILVVGLNSDSSVKQIKGKQRPIVPEAERAAVLAALTCVDYVIIFHEDNPFNVISELRPDVIIKGADWKGKEVIGSDVVTSYGGKVELLPYIDGASTSKIIKRILKKCKE